MPTASHHGRLLHRALGSRRVGDIRVRRRARSLFLRPLHRLDPLLLAEQVVLRRQDISSTSRSVRLLPNVTCLARHSVRAQLSALHRNTAVSRLPVPQTIFGVVQRLSRQLCLVVRWALFAGDDGCVVEQVDELARLRGEQDLLLSTLDDRGGVDVVGFLEFLTGDVGELRFGDEGLGFGADELLLEGYELGRFGLFVLELLDFVLDL